MLYAAPHQGVCRFSDSAQFWVLHERVLSPGAFLQFAKSSFGAFDSRGRRLVHAFDVGDRLFVRRGGPPKVRDTLSSNTAGRCYGAW